jgi:hypothetical protein
MKRFHLFEICDQDWCPSSIRDGVTDLLRFFENTGKYFDCIVDRLKEVTNNLKTQTIIDLASGSGGPWLRLYHQLNSTQDNDFKLTLTDRFPNEIAIKRVKDEFSGKVQYHPEIVNALEVPTHLRGFRTMFSSFHHFRPAEARAILQDAVSKNQGIGIFEFTERRLATLIIMALGTLCALLITPFMRPLNWRRLFWTYVIPAIPLVLLYDGYISCLRTYSPKEMAVLVSTMSGPKYKWDFGQYTIPSGLLRVTYTIGYPEKSIKADEQIIEADTTSPSPCP